MTDVAAALSAFRLAAITAAVLPVQMVAVRLGLPLAAHLPGWWHRRALAAMGVRVHVTGRPVADRPLLITPNHASWLDIPVIGSLMPISFVAKSEVASWPLFGLLARLQRTVFVDRTRRTATARTASELGARLARGDAMVLFAEGTSSGGGDVLPFRSALLGAARSAIVEGGRERVWVQPLTIAYTRLAGMPIGRAERARVGWYGDMELPGHLWGVFTAGGIDVEIVWGEARPFDGATDRKTLAGALEGDVRRALLATLHP